MKKIIFTSILSLSFFGLSLAQNQVFRVMNMNHTPDTDDDIEITDGYWYISNTTEESTSSMGFLTYNDSDSPINMQIEVAGMTNTDGSQMQLCYGLCVTSVEEFAFYPGYPVIINPNQHQGIFLDHFWHYGEESDDIIEYEFRFFQMDSEGFEIENTSLTFNYRYDRDAMSVSEVSSVSIAEVYPTVVKNSTTVELKENANVQIVNLEGKVVKSLTMNSGKTSLDMSGLASGVYWIQFQGVSGTSTMKKVVVK